MTEDTPPVPATDPDEGILTVDDVDFTQHDGVEEIGDGRYLVQTDGPVTPEERSLPERTSEDTNTEEGDVVSSVYAVHGNIIIGGERTSLAVNSNDVVEAFDDLLESYARATAAEMSVEEALDLLAKESDYL